MTTNSQNYELKISEDRVIRGSLDFPPGAPQAGAYPMILFCHGFKGFKDWGAFPQLCQRLAARGFLVNRFNFSLSGVGPCLDRHDEPEKFARNTYGDEMDDLHTLLKRQSEWLPIGCELAKVGVIGHSRGGLSAILAIGDGLAVDAAATLASPADSARVNEAELASWQAQGYREVLNARTGEVLRQDYSIVEDHLRQMPRYDMSAQMGRRSVPTLIIHGDADEGVPVGDAQTFAAACTARCKVEILAGSGHTFGTRHPSTEVTPDFERVIELCGDWFEEQLR